MRGPVQGVRRFFLRPGKDSAPRTNTLKQGSHAGGAAQ